MCKDLVFLFMLGCVPACFLECYFLEHSEKKQRNNHFSVFIICLTVILLGITRLITDDELYLMNTIGFLFPIFTAAFVNILRR